MELIYPVALDYPFVRDLFEGLETGDGAEFFQHVDDNVDWTVEGTHPLAGHYRSKAAFLAGTFDKLNKVLPEWAQLVVEHLLVRDDQAVVELRSLATARNGFRFDKSILLGSPLQRQHHRSRARLFGLRHGRAPLRREPDTR
jgi:ketosteroid isomerase-like protein